MEKARYDVLDICRYVVNRCFDKGYPATNLKLQKLLYYVQANFLVELDRPCFEDDIVAWDLGPVVVRAYRAYSHNGNAPLLKEDERISLPGEDKACIDEILAQLVNVSAYNLVNRTHSESPWKDAYADGYGKGSVITKEAIQDYFKPFRNSR